MVLFVEVGNSEVHIATKYPELRLLGLSLENGGNGIFAIYKTDLVGILALDSTLSQISN